MKDFIHSPCFILPTDQADIEADLIVNDEPMKFYRSLAWMATCSYRGKKQLLMMELQRMFDSSFRQLALE